MGKTFQFIASWKDFGVLQETVTFLKLQKPFQGIAMVLSWSVLVLMKREQISKEHTLLRELLLLQFSTILDTLQGVNSF